MRFVTACRCFLICMGLVGCSPSPKTWQSPHPEKIRVMSTTPMIDDLVGRIGKDRIHHASLMGSSIDPHSYELVKGDDEKFRCAQIVFYNGLGLEHSGSLSTLLSMHPHAISLGDIIRDKQPDLILQNRGQVDPHIWLDVSIWAEAVLPIVTHLSTIDPSGKEYYETQGALVHKELCLLDQWIQESLHAIPSEKRHLVTSHDAFNYFARRYLHQSDSSPWQDRFCAPEGLAPDGQLGFGDLQRVIDYLRTYHVQVVFPEDNVAQDSLKKIAEIARRTGFPIQIASEPLYSDTFPSGDSYTSMMQHNTAVLCSSWSHL